MNPKPKSLDPRFRGGDNRAQPEISVVVPAFNASAHISDCLEAVFSSGVDSFEVIVVDDHSTDHTVRAARSFPCKILVQEENQGPAACRNLGVDKAKGGIIVLLDSDILIPSDFLRRVRDFFAARPDVAILQAAYSDVSFYKNLFSQYKHYVFSFRASSVRNRFISYVHTACAAVRKEVFDAVGFDESLRRREDIDFGMKCSRKGYNIYLDSGFLVTHKKKYRVWDYTKYQFHAAREMALQHLLGQSRNFAQEYSSEKTQVYKKLWLLRPVLALALGCDLVWLVLGGAWPALAVFAAIWACSILLELSFRKYLWEAAPRKIFWGANFLYFYDGWVTGLGIFSAVIQSVFQRRFI